MLLPYFLSDPDDFGIDGKPRSFTTKSSWSSFYFCPRLLVIMKRRRNTVTCISWFHDCFFLTRTTIFSCTRKTVFLSDAEDYSSGLFLSSSSISINIIQFYSFFKMTPCYSVPLTAVAICRQWGYIAHYIYIQNSNLRPKLTSRCFQKHQLEYARLHSFLHALRHENQYTHRLTNTSLVCRGRIHITTPLRMFARVCVHMWQATTTTTRPLMNSLLVCVCACKYVNSVSAGLNNIVVSCIAIFSGAQEKNRLKKMLNSVPWVSV